MEPRLAVDVLCVGHASFDQNVFVDNYPIENTKCEIVSLLEQRRLTVPIWRTFPLAETAAALDASSAGHLNGKIVVLP